MEPIFFWTFCERELFSVREQAKQYGTGGLAAPVERYTPKLFGVPLFNRTMQSGK